MASSGATAWSKHFQGKGDIQTSVKVDSPSYDANDPTRKVGTIAAGTQVTYMKTAKYEQRALIQYKEKNKLVLRRVPFDNLAKPGVKSSGAASLKPQAFGVRDKKYSLTEYEKTIKDFINDRKDLSAAIKVYLGSLFDYCTNGKTTEAKLAKIFAETRDDLPLNDINKDFGEVVGPVTAFYSQLLKSKKILLKPTMEIYIPEKPNEPLMDYSIYSSNRQFIISAKSGTTTNVVKPQDIIDLLKKNQAKHDKWKNTKEYGILYELANNTALLGPIKAIPKIDPTLITQDSADKITGPTSSLTPLSTFIKQNEYLKTKTKPTLTEIMYECEKIIQKETKTGSLNMNAIFADAIEEQVLYIKFELNSRGIPQWDVIASDNINKPDFGRVYLRTKNGYTRSSDRMGIQV